MPDHFSRAPRQPPQSESKKWSWDSLVSPARPWGGVTEAVEQIRRGMLGKGEKLRDGSFQKHLQLCNYCKFSLWPPTNLTSQASPSPQRGSPWCPLLPLPLFQPFHLLSSHRLPHITTQRPPGEIHTFQPQCFFAHAFPSSWSACHLLFYDPFPLNQRHLAKSFSRNANPSLKPSYKKKSSFPEPSRSF